MTTFKRPDCFAVHTKPAFQFTSSVSSSFINQSCRNPRTSCPTFLISKHKTHAPRQNKSPCASLVVDLTFKAAEVFAATLVSTSVIPSSPSSPTTDSKPTLNIDALVTDMRNIINTLSTTTTTRTATSTTSNNKKWVKLVICIFIDLIGSGGLGIPLLSDFLDIFTAPLSAVMLHALFGNFAITFAGLSEELLPGTDGIPTATLAWIAQQKGYIASTDTSHDVVSETVIDVDYDESLN